MSENVNYKELWSSVFDAMEDAVFMIDAECNIKKVNSAFLLLTDKDEKYFSGKKCNEVIDCSGLEEEYYLHRKASDNSAFASGEYYDNILGKWVYLRSVPLFDKDNIICGSVCMLTDITERKLREEKLQELTMAVELNPCCVMITDREAKIEYVNKKFLQLTGYSFNEVLGKNPRILNAGEQSKEFYKELWDTILSGNEWRGQFHNRKKGGQMYWESASISSVKDNEGKITHFIAVKEDITEHKRMEENLILANSKLRELDRLKSEFVSTVSHELRTPLAIMKEGVSLVTEKITGPLNDRQERTLGAVFSNIDRLTQLINDLLDISRIESGKLSLKKSFINLSFLLDDLCSKIKLQSQAKRQEFVCILPEEPVFAFVDQDKFIQIFTNLISNAIKYTPDSGSIKVELIDRGESIEVSVADSGIGISREDLPKVFGKFEQFGRSPGAGSKGTGLGLAITKELVNMHKGNIWVESELGKGSKFVVSLPNVDCEDVFKESSARLIDDASRDDKPVTFIILRIDNFTEINNNYKFADVNLVLRNIESQINKTLRGKEDIVRIGKKEIIIALFGVGKDISGKVYSRIEKAITEYSLKSNSQLLKELKIKAVFVSYPEEAKTIDELSAMVNCASDKDK